MVINRPYILGCLGSPSPGSNGLHEPTGLREAGLFRKAHGPFKTIEACYTRGSKYQKMIGSRSQMPYPTWFWGPYTICTWTLWARSVGMHFGLVENLSPSAWAPRNGRQSPSSQ